MTFLSFQIDFPITVTNMRNRIQLLTSTVTYRVEAFFVQPPVSTARNLYLAPFNFDLWMAMSGSWVLLITAMKICAWLKSLLTEPESIDENVVDDIYLWAVGAICQQGWVGFSLPMFKLAPFTEAKFLLTFYRMVYSACEHIITDYFSHWVFDWSCLLCSFFSCNCIIIINKSSSN